MISKTNAHETLIEAIAAVQSGGQFLEDGYLTRYVELTRDGRSGGVTANGQLSQREAQIAEAAARGLRNREIAKSQERLN